MRLKAKKSDVDFESPECEHAGMQMEILSGEGKRIGWACATCGRPVRGIAPPPPKAPKAKRVQLELGPFKP